MGIYEQFIEGMQDSEGMRKIRIVGKINNLEFNYFIIQRAAKYLSVAYDPEIIDMLRIHMRVTGNFNPDNLEEYFNDIQVILNRAQRIKTEIAALEAEQKAMKAFEQTAEKNTRKQFDKLIAQVSIYAKFHIDKSVVSVAEFTEYYTSRRESFEAMEETYAKSKK